jgi:hypothetical protein
MSLGCNFARAFAQERSFLRFTEKTEIKDNQIIDIENEIMTINLVNCLSLKPQQAAFILEEAKNLKALYWECYKKSLEFKPDLMVVYSKIKEQLEEEKSVWSTPLKYQLVVVTGKLSDLSYQFKSAIEESTKKVEGQLEGFQLRALDGFIDCILPSQEAGFIGQSERNSAFVFVLGKVKAMSKSEYAAQKERLAQQELDSIKTNYRNKNCQHFNPQSRKEDILKIFEKVRRMDSVSFELEKEELGRKLRGKMICTPPRLNREQKIVRLLLSEQAIHILEKRANKENL